MQFSINQYLQEEVQTSAWWRISFDTGPLSAYNEELSKWAITVDPLPNGTPQNVQFPVHGYTLNQPGINNYNAEVTITFTEPISLPVANAIKEVYDRTYSFGNGDVQGKSEPLENIYSDVTFTALSRAETPTAIIKGFKGLITSFTPGNFTDGADGGQAWQPSFTILFNYYNWE